MRYQRFLQAYAVLIVSFFPQIALMSETNYDPTRENSELLREELFNLQDLLPPIFLTIPNAILQIFLEKLAIPLGFGNPLTGMMMQMQRPLAYLGIEEAEIPIQNKIGLLRATGSSRESQSDNSLQVLYNFSDKLASTLGGILNIEGAIKELQNLPNSVSQELAYYTEIYGDALVETVKHGDSALSALVQQLIAPIDDDDRPILLPFIAEPHTSKNSNAETMEKVLSGAEQPRANQSVSAAESLSSRRRIVNYAKTIGKLYGLESSYAIFAGAFVDEFLIPAGVANDVADMMDAAWEVLNGDSVAMKDMFQPNLDEDLGDEANAMVHICSALGELLGTKRFHASVAKSFISFILVPLNILRPVASLLAANAFLLRQFYQLRSILQKMAMLAQNEPLIALFLPKALATMKARAGRMFFSGLLESNDVSREDLLNMAISKLIHYGQIIDKGFSMGAAATFLYKADDSVLSSLTSKLNAFMDDLSNYELCQEIKTTLLDVIDKSNKKNIANVIEDVKGMCISDEP